MKINEHVLKLKESATLAINLKAKKLRTEGRAVYHWGFGQSPFPVPQKIQEELKKRVHHKEYLPTLGLKILRETISSFFNRDYQLDINPENIFIGLEVRSLSSSYSIFRTPKSSYLPPAG